MKSYHANSGAGVAGLRLEEHDGPVPGPREVLLRVRANSLNFRELSVLRGTYPLPIKPDVVMGADGAGEIVAAGPGVTRVRVGDRVAAAMFPRWLDGPFSWEVAPQLGGSLDGMMAEQVVAHEDAVVKLPEHLTFEEGATLPCAAVTAWNALTGARPLKAGEVVLTLGTGSVSLFAIQFAQLFGARVISTTSSDEKAQQLRALGASDVINYRTTPDWHLTVRELTSGRGVDQVVEVGGGGTLERSIRSTAVEGMVNFIGRLDAGSSNIDANVLYGAIATVRVVAAGSRAHFIAMNRALSTSGLRPIIARSFPFEELPAAFRYFEETQPFGKVVLRNAQSE
ncbi:MAG TPA: NAD(P)-dependent alcohol dehydrogenase [Polyangiaceae bacterium]|jgi:NADPH:quinone reductase-like Zn-dependent oxidoreductase|nr:NAD(P)-dependent alcohol dehydrogenase [Polyangiaceae bacterium]